jgi:hypothetical protein
MQIVPKFVFVLVRKTYTYAINEMDRENIASKVANVKATLLKATPG